MRKKSEMGKCVWEGAGMMRRKRALQKTGRTGNARVFKTQFKERSGIWGTKGMRARVGFLSSLPQCLLFYY